MKVLMNSSRTSMRISERHTLDRLVLMILYFSHFLRHYLCSQTITLSFNIFLERFSYVIFNYDIGLIKSVQGAGTIDIISVTIKCAPFYANSCV